MGNRETSEKIVAAKKTRAWKTAQRYYERHRDRLLKVFFREVPTQNVGEVYMDT